MWLHYIWYCPYARCSLDKGVAFTRGGGGDTQITRQQGGHWVPTVWQLCFLESLVAARCQRRISSSFKASAWRGAEKTGLCKGVCPSPRKKRAPGLDNRDAPGRGVKEGRFLLGVPQYHVPT